MKRSIMALACTLAALASAARAQDRLPASLAQIGFDQRLNEQVPPDLVFHDEAGRAVRLGEYFRGRPVILVLAYFRCPMLCNQVLNGLLDGLRKVSLNAGDDFEVVVVSFDARETPELAAAKKAVQDIWMAETKEAAKKALDTFEKAYGAKYPKAVECLVKAQEALLTFYDFPAEHWIHLRTTNPIESTFATVRLRTAKTKGAGSRLACLTMVWKLAQAAERRWRALNGGSQLMADVIAGVRFKDGIKEAAA